MDIYLKFDVHLQIGYQTHHFYFPVFVDSKKQENTWKHMASFSEGPKLGGRPCESATSTGGGFDAVGELRSVSQICKDTGYT